MGSRTDRKSIKAEIDHITQEGTRFLQSGSVQFAVNNFSRAYKKASDLNSTSVKASAAFNLGAILIATGKAKDGLELLQEAFLPDDGREHGHINHTTPDIHYNMGLGYEMLNQPQEAIRFYESAVRLYGHIEGGLLQQVSAACRLGDLYLKSGKASNAEKILSSAWEAVQLHRGVNDNHTAELCRGRAKSCIALGKYEEAIELLNQCRDIADKLLDSLDIAVLYNDLGLCYSQCGMLVQAARCFEVALPISRNCDGGTVVEATVTQNLGACYNSVKQFEKSLGFHRAAIKLHAKLGQRNSQGECFSNLAYAYCQLGDLEEATENFLHACQAAKDADDSRGHWQALEGLGTVSFNRGQIDKALAYFKQCLSVLSSASTFEKAQERIVSRLTDALRHKVSKEPIPLKSHNLLQQQQQQQQQLQQQQRQSVARERISFSSEGQSYSVSDLPARSRGSFRESSGHSIAEESATLSTSTEDSDTQTLTPSEDVEEESTTDFENVSIRTPVGQNRPQSGRRVPRPPDTKRSRPSDDRQHRDRPMSPLPGHRPPVRDEDAQRWAKRSPSRPEANRPPSGKERPTGDELPPRERLASTFSDEELMRKNMEDIVRSELDDDESSTAQSRAKTPLMGLHQVVQMAQKQHEALDTWRKGSVTPPVSGNRLEVQGEVHNRPKDKPQEEDESSSSEESESSSSEEESTSESDEPIGSGEAEQFRREEHRDRTIDRDRAERFGRDEHRGGTAERKSSVERQRSEPPREIRNYRREEFQDSEDVRRKKLVEGGDVRADSPHERNERRDGQRVDERSRDDEDDRVAARNTQGAQRFERGIKEGFTSTPESLRRLGTAPVRPDFESGTYEKPDFRDDPENSLQSGTYQSIHPDTDLSLPEGPGAGGTAGVVSLSRLPRSQQGETNDTRESLLYREYLQRNEAIKREVALPTRAEKKSSACSIM